MKSTPASSKFFRYSIFLFFSTILLCPTPSLANQTPRNPNSAKECAICHYRWIDTFFIDGKGTDLVPYQETKVVAEPQICFSCHDGSVADSRGKVYNDHRHPINKPPPADMEIPDIFPLDDKGNMQCFTCHTAHGVSSEMGIERAVFIRTSNNNSSMCMMCHKGKEGGPAAGNHPIGATELKIPDELLQRGSVEGVGKNQVICQTCHTVHGSPFNNFLVENNRDSAQLCIDCHAEKAGLLNTGHDLRRTAADAKNIKGQTAEQSGICGACHLVHGSQKVALWARELPEKGGSISQDLCVSCHNKQGIASEKILKDKSHPVNITPKDKGMHPDLPAYNGKGKRVSFQAKDALLTCSTCHDPHLAGTAVQAKMTPPQSSFLRVNKENENSSMCMICHKGKEGGSAAGNHPIGTTELKIPEELLRRSLVDGSGENQVICQTCHKVHGSSSDKFLVADNRDSAQLCINCHGEKAGLLNTGHDLRRTAPTAKNIKEQTPEQAGICGACHLVHGAKKVALWARELPEKSKNTTQDLCVGCHNKQGLASKKFLKGYSHPVNVSIKNKGIKSNLPLYDRKGKRVSSQTKDALLSCPTCHDPHQGGTARQAKMTPPRSQFLRVKDGSAVRLCSQCHKKQARISQSDHDLQRSGSATTNTKGQSPAASGVCGVCHLVHGAQTKDLWARKVSSTSKYPAQDLCLTCHNKTGVADKKVIGNHSHPVDIDPGKRGIRTSLPLYNRQGERSGKGVVACLTCHDPHQWNPGNAGDHGGRNPEGNGRNSFLRLAAAPMPVLCENCHPAKAYIEKTDHDLTVTGPKSKNSMGQTPKESGVCGACHIVHNGANKVRLWARDYGAGKGIMDKMCNSCHSETGSGSSKIPTVSTHPEKQLIANPGRNKPGKANYFPLFDEKTGKFITVGDIACASCHDVHQWNPKKKSKGSGNNPEGKATNSFLRMQTYNMICKDCHGLDSLFRFKYYHDSKKRKPSPAP